MRIMAKNVHFEYGLGATVDMSTSGGLRRALTCSGEVEIQQGHVIALLGPKGEGKSTLLRIFGGVILPKPEVLFVPSHLRVLHISSEPLFFKGSLFENVTFGVSCPADGEHDRVMEICRTLGIRQSVLQMVDQGNNGEVQIWSEVLSLTQRCLLCLARAFVANPELMCIHKPTMPFDEPQSGVVFKMLRDFVQKKGVELDEKTRHMRRPRTCIMTSSKVMGVEAADEVYLVSHKDGIKKLQKDEIDKDLLLS